MKATIALAAAAALLGGAAIAQPQGPRQTTVCLDVAGHQRPVTCRIGEASRIAQREDICQCLAGGQPITIAVCPSGVRPPGESAAYERGRYAAVQGGSLIGANWRGAPICVATRSLAGG
ncbi:MAG: hypothetical protein E7812_11350 [Phenylobacterium sp.]|nr:MAG: hypothetical protein E7812_11350 [Phenylobacterium sp.]